MRRELSRRLVLDRRDILFLSRLPGSTMLSRVLANICLGTRIYTKQTNCIEILCCQCLVHKSGFHTTPPHLLLQKFRCRVLSNLVSRTQKSHHTLDEGVVMISTLCPGLSSTQSTSGGFDSAVVGMTPSYPYTLVQFSNLQHIKSQFPPPTTHYTFNPYKTATNNAIPL